MKSKNIRQRDNNHNDDYNNFSHSHNHSQSQSQSHNDSHRKQSSPIKPNENNEAMRILSDKTNPIEETNDIIFKKKIISNNNNNNQYNRGKMLYYSSNNHHNKFRQLNDKIILNDNTTINWTNKWNYATNNDLFQRNKKETLRNHKSMFPQGSTTNTVGVESTKKRNNTAKTINKYNLGETNSTNIFRRTTARLGSTFKPGKKLELKQNRMLIEMNNPKNPYSTYWTNKILDKRYNMELCSDGFLNGIPLIKLNYKKNMFAKITKKQIKEDLIKMKKKNEEIEQETTDIELKPEVDDQFNTNMKNFFKARKDIQEESVEKEEDDEEKKNDLIEFPKIYNFFQR